jgi:NAD(P)-dependent dehydrogenase (short-subunit alcohol dehydrogenase family)
MQFESLRDKVVLITGGARGIGKGLATACLQEGARVIITNLNEEVGLAAEAELKPLGPVRAVRCDATRRDEVEALLDDIWQQEGPLDLVFSNAGRGGNERALDASLEDIRALFATNFESAVIMAQSYVPRVLGAGRSGHIMFTGSEHSVGLPEDNEELGFVFYGASKHSMLIFAEWLRADLQGTDVSVSLLMPGPVMTESVRDTLQVLQADPDNAALRAVFSKKVEQSLRARLISTEQCAQYALQGLRAGLFYIPTQPHIQHDVERRYREIQAAFKALHLSSPSAAS